MVQICTKSFVGWGFAPDPTKGAYSAPHPVAGIGVGAAGGRETREGREKEGEVRGKEFKEGKRRGRERMGFSDGLTALDRIILVIYQDGCDGRLVVGLSCLTEWVYSCYFLSNR